MRMFVIPKGTYVSVVKYSGPIDAREVQLIDRAVFALEEMTIDPLGHVGIGPVGPSITNGWARQGLYGFRLPKPAPFLPAGEAARGWEDVLVPLSLVEVL